MFLAALSKVSLFFTSLVFEISLVIFFLTLICKVIIRLRRREDKEKALFALLQVGLTLSLTSIGTLWAITKTYRYYSSLVKAEELLSMTGGYFLWLVIFLFLCCIFMAFSENKPSRFFLNKDSFLAIHIPNFLGMTSIWYCVSIFQRIGVL